jgi:DNA polymerase-3 subunit chi
LTQIEFHTGVGDKLHYTCRLLRKAALRGAQVVVHADAAQARELDGTLWVFDPLAFVPHARAGAKAPAETPIWIVEQLADAPHHQVLLNLSPAVAAGFETFERLIELVGADDEDKQAGRRRWRHYQERGYAVVHREAAR